MKISDVLEKIEYIKQVHKHDFEAAHSAEDDLHVEILQFIASGECKNPQELCKIALTTLDIDFIKMS